MPKMNKLNERKYDSEYITWKTANEDISKQRKKGYKGKRFVICPKLVNQCHSVKALHLR